MREVLRARCPGNKVSTIRGIKDLLEDYVDSADLVRRIVYEDMEHDRDHWRDRAAVLQSRLARISREAYGLDD